MPEQQVVPALRITSYERRVRVTEPPNDDLGHLSVTVTDPDGNQLRFMEPART